jgi:hypothetical protein
MTEFSNKSKTPEVSAPATTTAEQDLRTAGQRRINLIWEYTQSGIAILLVVSAVIITVVPTLQGHQIEVPDVLTSSLFLVLGFYFGRTNHARIGDEPPRSRPLDDRNWEKR